MTHSGFKPLLLFIAIGFSLVATAQRRAKEHFDILHYSFDIQLNDSSEVIYAEAEIQIAYPDLVQNTSVLDLASQNRRGLGMSIDYLLVNGKEAQFVHQSDQIEITNPASLQVGDTLLVKLKYSGEPHDGLIISKNSNKDRTFFSEHWPNKAHHWLPVVDHPSERATCKFTVTAPAVYDVVSNGTKQSEEILTSGMKRTQWKMDYPIPSKVMVIGVAKFNQFILDDKGITTIWTYDKPDSKAQEDFSDAAKIYDLLDKLLGDYPFTKCDHVESTTRFGGLENAGNIFYPEKSLTGKHGINHTIAHEIGHQWFGNSVSEADWEHIWISEGLATYLEYYYVQEMEGEDAFMRKLASDEEKVLNYQFRYPGQAIVQKDVKVLDDILHPMTYEKPAWVLRMLRTKIGDEAFNEILSTFYQRYKFGNATTEDFIALAKQVSDQDLDLFFHQWFYVPGVPKLEYFWKYSKGRVIVDFTQLSLYTYQLEFDIKLEYQDQSTSVIRVSLTDKNQTIELKEAKPKKLVVDPNNLILGEVLER